jgi:hypothetical protein
LGSPAVMNGISTLRPCSRRSAKRLEMRLIP